MAMRVGMRMAMRMTERVGMVVRMVDFGALSGQVARLAAVVASSPVGLLLLGGPFFRAVFDDVPGFIAVETFFHIFLVLSLLRTIFAFVAFLLAVIATVEGFFKLAIFAPVVRRPAVKAVVLFFAWAFSRNVTMTSAIETDNHIYIFPSH